MAQTLKFGKGTWATKTGSSMAYNDQNGNYKPLPFNVERDSIATRVNKQGLIEVVGKDKLRIDYTDSAKGVALLENSSTNLITYSEDFSNSYWTKGSNTTVINNYAISPEGKQNATRIQMPDASGTFLDVNLSGLQGNTLTVSFYAKNNGGTTNIITFLPDNNSQSISLTDKWVRYDFTGIAASNVRVGIDNINGDGDVDFLLYGFQLEQNSFATSYIPTYGSTVQRQADVVSGSGNSEVFNDSEGVLFADIAALDDTVSAYNSIGIGSGSTFNRIGIGFEPANEIYAYKHDGTNSWLPSTTMGIKLYNKVALSYNTNDNHLWVNGFKIVSNTTVGDMGQPTSLGFEASYGGEQFYGKTKEIGYYDATLTDSELEYLTSYRSLNELVTELNLNTL